MARNIEDEEQEQKAKRGFAFTAASAVQMGVSAVLLILSLVLGYMAFARWRFKASLAEGYREYAVGNMGRATPALKDALGWRPDHAGARELLAKIEAESGALDSAARQYETLRAAGHNPAPVRVGLGVVHLRRAEKAEDLKQVQEHVAKAREEFKAAAAEAPEGEIGLGHCDLLLAWRLKDEKARETARAAFEKVRRKLDADAGLRARITREGLLDYYAGLGKVLSDDPAYDPAATAAWRACGQYARRWSVPQAGVLASEARRFPAWKDGAEGLNALKPEATRLRNDASNLFRGQSRDAGQGLQEAWLVYTLSLTQAWARAGNLNEHALLMADFKGGSGGLSDRVEPVLVDALVRLELAAQDHPNAGVLDGHARAAATPLLDLVDKRLTASDEATQERRARALNALGWIEAWRGSYTNSKALLGSAAKRLEEASKLRPQEFVYARNALVVHKRIGSAAGVTAPLLERAKAAAAAAGAKDFDDLQKHLEAK
jgi:hypothetical protein